MGINLILKTIARIGSVVAVVSLMACASSMDILKQGYIKQEDVTVEYVNSGSAKIVQAFLYTSETTGMLLQGELKRLLHGRNPIPGYLHVELIDHDGVVFKEANIGYKRRNPESRISRFTLEVPIRSSDIKSVRVSHHPDSYVDDTAESPWRDVCRTKIDGGV